MILQRFDLNLLKTLVVLYEERSVQRAASRLHITPSAVSHALSRLRRNLADPLFVNTGTNLAPTPRCLEILSTVRPLIRELDQVLGSPAHERGSPDPLALSRTIAIAMPGALEVSILPLLAASMADRAPRWELEVRAFQRRSYEVDLISGEVDAVLSIGGHTPHHPDLVIETLWHDDLVSVQGPFGPLSAGDGVDINTVLGWPQIYSVPWPKSQNYLDIQLAREGRRRTTTVSMPSYAAAGEVLCQTSLVAIMPDRTAAALAKRHQDLRIIPIRPAIVTPLCVEFSRTFVASPAGSWFRDLLFQSAASVSRYPQ